MQWDQPDYVIWNASWEWVAATEFFWITGNVVLQAECSVVEIKLTFGFSKSIFIP